MDERLPSYVTRCVAANPGNGDYLITLQNQDPIGVVHVWGVNCCIGNFDVVTGVLIRVVLNRGTTTATLAGGTDLTSSIVKMDTTDTLLSTIYSRSMTTTTISNKLSYATLILSQDNPTVSTLDADMQIADLGSRNQMFWHRGDWPLVKPIFLRSDGTTHDVLTIEVSTNDPAGSNLETCFHFTVEGG
jgi:hypothetical protein